MAERLLGKLRRQRSSNVEVRRGFFPDVLGAAEVAVSSDEPAKEQLCHS